MDQSHRSAFDRLDPEDHGHPLDGLTYQTHNDVSEMADIIHGEATPLPEFNIYGEAISPSDISLFEDKPQLSPRPRSLHTSHTTSTRTACTNSIIILNGEVYDAKPFKIFIDARDADEAAICHEVCSIRHRGEQDDWMKEDFLHEHDKKTVLGRRKKEDGMHRFSKMGRKENPGDVTDGVGR